MKNSNSFQIAARQSLSLSRSNYSTASKHTYRLLQDVGNDKDYNLIIDQKTTYLTQDGRQITAEQLAQLSGISKRKQQPYQGSQGNQDNDQQNSINKFQKQLSQNSIVVQGNKNFDRINQEKQSENSEEGSSVRNNNNWKRQSHSQKVTQNQNKSQGKHFKNDKNQIASVSNLKPITNISQIQKLGKSPTDSRISQNLYNTSNSNSKITQKMNTKTSFTRMKNSKVNKNVEQFIDHGELGNIEAIIDQIELFMQKSTPIIKASNQDQEKYITKNKQKSKLAGTSKNQFRNQWKQSFNKINKLDQMLQGYKTTQDAYQKHKKPKQEKNGGLNFGDNSTFGYKHEYGKQTLQNDYENEYLDQQNEFNEHFQQGQEPISLIVLVKWQALPIFPIQYKDIMLKFPSYPQQNSYQTLLKKVLQNRIKHFSIFYKHEHTSQNIAGVGQHEQGQNLCLLSQQQYAMKWESMFSGKQFLTEQETQSLMEYDIQWYRTVVDFAYKGGLQEVLERQNGYDIYKYIKIVRQLSTDKTNSSYNPTLIDQNRVEFVKGYIKNQQTLIMKGKPLKNSILATKSSDINHSNIIKQKITPTFVFKGAHNLTLSLINLQNSGNSEYEMCQNGDIIVRGKIAVRVKDFDQENIESQTSIAAVNQNIKVTFQVVPIKQTDDLQIRIRKGDSEQKSEQIKLKDEVQFGKIYAIYEKSI